MNQTFDGIKQQLWDYLRIQTEYADSLAREILRVNLLTGDIHTELVYPSGLAHEIAFIQEELEMWMQLEKEAKKGL